MKLLICLVSLLFFSLYIYILALKIDLWSLRMTMTLGKEKK